MSILLAIQTVLSVILVISILLQSRAAGLSATFGGGANSAYVQRRGAEKFLYQATIIISIAFLVLTILQWYV